MSVSELERVKTHTVTADRVAGAIIGGLIGDALGVGPHWYYDIEEQRRDYGNWITGYTDPQPDRYHARLKAGQLSQTGYITQLLLQSIVDRSGYDEADFLKRLDEELFAHTDGTPNSGPGGFTHKSIRGAYQKHIVAKRPWGEIAGNTDTTEAAERIVPIAVLYAADGDKAAALSHANIRLLQDDPNVVAHSTTFAAVLAALVRGKPLDAQITQTLSPLAQSSALPSSAFASGTAPLSAPGHYAGLADNPAVSIEPASSVANVYGLSCAIYFVLPGAYYLASRFRNDFESAVLHAINGGGQNLARAYLTGTLVGAQVGLSGIPQRFIDGLENSDTLLKLAREIGRLAEAQ